MAQTRWPETWKPGDGEPVGGSILVLEVLALASHRRKEGEAGADHDQCFQHLSNDAAKNRDKAWKAFCADCLQQGAADRGFRGLT
jgi:hypothetical protein